MRARDGISSRPNPAPSYFTVNRVALLVFAE